MNDNEQALIPMDAHYVEVAEEYDDMLLLAGIAADHASVQDVFSAYHAETSANTQRRQRGDLALFCQYLAAAKVKRTPDALYSDAQAWRGVSYGIVQGFVRYLAREGYAVGSINIRLATIRQYCRLAGPQPEGAGVLDKDTLLAILTVKGYSEKKGVNLDETRELEGTPTRRGSKKAHATDISVAQVRRLKKFSLDAKHSRPRAHDQLLAARDAFIIGLLSEHALRCSEVAALDIEHLDLENNTISILRKKTSTQQEIHTLKPHTSMAADAYMQLLKDRGITSGPLFFGYSGKRIATRTINERIAVLGRAVGIENKRLSPHDLRHFFSFDAFKNGSPLDKIMKAAGWRTPAMALRYADRAGIANEGVKLSDD